MNSRILGSKIKIDDKLPQEDNEKERALRAGTVHWTKIYASKQYQNHKHNQSGSRFMLLQNTLKDSPLIIIKLLLWQSIGLSE
jgi:hypothetical protein